MDIRHGYTNRLFTSVSFFKCEALPKELLLAGCEAQKREFECADDQFGGVVTIFGAAVSVTDLITSGIQHTRELKSEN